MSDTSVMPPLNVDDHAHIGSETRQGEGGTYVSSVSGPVVGSVASGRDTNIANNQTIYYAIAAAEQSTQQHPYFTELHLNVQEDVFCLSRTSSLLENLDRQPVLLLHTDPDVHAATFLRHLAISFQSVLRKRSSERRVWEFTGEIPDTFNLSHKGEIPDTFNLSHKIEQIEEPTIFVLPQATRRLLGWDVISLRDTAASRHHVIIATTDLPARAWKLTPHEGAVWHKLAAAGLYTSRYLGEMLDNQLEEQRDSLPTSIRAELLSGRTIGGVALTTVATQLQKPLNISVFVQLLAMRQAFRDPGEIDILIREVAQTSLQQTLKKWYHNGLRQREQLLAVGMSFLPDLQEDQCLDHLQRLMHEAWAQPTPTQQIIDRIDVEPLLPFFDFVEKDVLMVRIEARFASQRRMLFAEAWATHRRHIKQALPWLIDVVRTSMMPRIGQNEHYGTKRLRDELRQTIGESLSDLGLIADRLVEQWLLHCVADNHEGMHVFVARVVKRWYELEDKTVFFALLTRWDQDVRTEAFIRAILEQRYGKYHENARDYLRTTMVLICTYAATEDKPGDLSNKLQQWLLKLTHEAGKQTQWYLQKYTLRMLTPIHLSRMDDVFGAMTYYKDARLAISQQFTRIYATHGKAVVYVLRSWMKQAFQARDRYVPGTDPILADTLLATVALTLGEIPYDELATPLSFEQASVYLQRMLGLPRHPMVRTAVRVAQVRRARTNTAALDAVLTDMTDAERADIVTLLTDAYLEERRNLLGDDADCFFPLDGKKYPVLLFGERPRTRIEQVIENWIMQGQQCHARQIALEAATAFVQAFDIKEDRFIQQKREEVWQQEQLVSQMPERNPFVVANLSGLFISDAEASVPARYSFFVDDFVPVFVTLDKPSVYCQIIRDVLPIAQQIQENNHEAMLFLLRQKWAESTEAELQLIADCLDHALDLTAQGWNGLLKDNQLLHNLWQGIRTLARIIREKYT